MINCPSCFRSPTKLGSLLFIIYINDLPRYIRHSTVRLFADDCVLYKPIYDYNDTALLQQDIHSLQIWSQDWLMNFNALKCYSMSVTLSRNSIDTTYYLNGIPLSVVNHCKYQLGHNNLTLIGTNMLSKRYLKLIAC